MGKIIDAKTCQSFDKSVLLSNCITGAELFGDYKEELAEKKRAIIALKHRDFPFMITETGDFLYVIRAGYGEAILRRLRPGCVLDNMPFGIATLKHGAGRAVIHMPQVYEIEKTSPNRRWAACSGAILTTITSIKGREERDEAAQKRVNVWLDRP